MNAAFASAKLLMEFDASMHNIYILLRTTVKCIRFIFDAFGEERAPSTPPTRQRQRLPSPSVDCATIIDTDNHPPRTSQYQTPKYQTADDMNLERAALWRGVLRAWSVVRGVGELSLCVSSENGQQLNSTVSEGEDGPFF